MDKPVGGIETYSLPLGSSKVLREPNTNKPPLHWVAGPDASGRIVFVQNDMVNKRYALIDRSPDGLEKTVFEADGDAIWDHAIGKYGALSPHSGLVAFGARFRLDELASPDALLSEGELEVWSLDKRERASVRAALLDDSLCWYPDGKRLAYTALVPASDAERVFRNQVGLSDSFGRKYMKWKRVPIVHVIDISTGESRWLHVGERPVLSPDGRILLVRDFEQQWRILDVDSNQSKPFDAPGAVYPGAIALVDSQTALYWALQTAGAETKFTDNNSPVVGKKQMRSLKIVDLRDGRYQTVISYLDPRRSVSFGGWQPPNESTPK
jgi:hypothetical protein